ncbi:hypothetical protein [Cupriavidus plantarum]|uniref:Uncharacterized protein n=1 Tax=Cupriavidus plantarum TaxID=942865 RepID=A0A316F5B4_9BURK|nr:hypothetical protein [Cupriavidus plantarum]PWK38679.1 hypothetical protein C7419_1012578 [Cupriavidus plantarum]
MNTVEIPIPDPEDEPDLRSYINQFITDEIGSLYGELVPALDLDVGDERATIDDIEVDDVEVHGDKIIVYYTIQYSAHYGCSDIDYAEDDQRKITGVRDGENWVFDWYVSPERLAPNEEL